MFSLIRNNITLSRNAPKISYSKSLLKQKPMVKIMFSKNLFQEKKSFYSSKPEKELIDINLINNEEKNLNRIKLGFNLLFTNIISLPKLYLSSIKSNNKFEKKIYLQSIRDFLLTALGLSILTSSQFLIFNFYMIIFIVYPEVFVPQVFKVPTEFEIDDFVFTNLAYVDVDSLGYVPLETAENLFRKIKISPSRYEHAINYETQEFFYKLINPTK